MSSNLYRRGDTVFLYVKFKNQNGQPATNVVNPMVRIVHEKNGNIVDDLPWTNLNKFSDSEYIYSFKIPYDADYGLREVLYVGEVDGKIARVIEDFHIVPTSTLGDNILKITGLVHQLRTGYPLIGVNIKVTNLDDSEVFAETFTKDDGSWECYLYPGEYKFVFSKFGFKPVTQIVQIENSENGKTEFIFNNIALESELDSKKGNGIYIVNDRYVLNNGIPLNNLKVECYNILDLNSGPIAEDITNDDGEWQLYLDPGMYMLKVYGNSMNQDFDYIFRLKVEDNGEFHFENISSNIAVANEDTNLTQGNGSIKVEDYVQDHKGNPIIDVQVNVFHPNDLNTIIAQDYTNVEGKWTVYLDPGEYVFEFYHPEFEVITENRTIK